MKHNHQEAFCLMKYRADDNSEVEWIWNSRDGVTPFIILLRSGKHAQHVDWQRDIYLPLYTPGPGERIFVDLTPERAREIAEDNLEAWKDLDTNMYGPLPNLDDLVDSYLRPGAPDLIEVK